MTATLTLEVSADRWQYQANLVPEGKPPFPEADLDRRQLIVTDRAVIGRRHSDGQPVEVVDVHLPDGPVDDAVSHRHCVIERDATGWYVSDVGSRNGTYLNNSRVRGGAGTRTHRLRVGDKIRIGLWTCLTVVTVDEPAPGRGPR